MIRIKNSLKDFKCSGDVDGGGALSEEMSLIHHFVHFVESEG